MKQEQAREIAKFESNEQRQQDAGNGEFLRLYPPEDNSPYCVETYAAALAHFTYMHRAEVGAMRSPTLPLSSAESAAAAAAVAAEREAADGEADPAAKAAASSPLSVGTNKSSNKSLELRSSGADLRELERAAGFGWQSRSVQPQGLSAGRSARSPPPALWRRPASWCWPWVIAAEADGTSAAPPLHCLQAWS